MVGETVKVLIVILLVGSVALGQDRFKLRVQAPEPARFYVEDTGGKAWAPDGCV